MARSKHHYELEPGGTHLRLLAEEMIGTSIMRLIHRSARERRRILLT